MNTIEIVDKIIEIDERMKELESLKAQYKEELIASCGCGQTFDGIKGKVTLGAATERKIVMIALSRVMGKKEVENLLNMKRMKIKELTLTDVKGYVNLDDVTKVTPCSVSMKVQRL